MLKYLPCVGSGSGTQRFEAGVYHSGCTTLVVPALCDHQEGEDEEDEDWCEEDPQTDEQDQAH